MRINSLKILFLIKFVFEPEETQHFEAFSILFVEYLSQNFLQIKLTGKIIVYFGKKLCQGTKYTSDFDNCLGNGSQK